MSALQVPQPTTVRRPARRGERPYLRLVEVPASSLAPSGPLQAWRRRLGALLVLAALVVVALELVSGPAATVEPATTPVSAATVVVQPGQTLWDVARDHAPADVAADAYVAELEALNGIDAASVDAWQVLRLPSA